MKELKKFFDEHRVVSVSLPPDLLESADIRVAFDMDGESWELWEVFLENNQFKMWVSNGNGRQQLLTASPDVEDDLFCFCQGVYEFWDQITPDDIQWGDYLHDLKADLRNNRLLANGDYPASKIQGFKQNITEIEKEIDAIYRQGYDSILDWYKEKGTLIETFEYYLI